MTRTRQFANCLEATMILHHEIEDRAGSFVGNRYFGGCVGGDMMRHLSRKYFNLLLVHDRHRKSAATAGYLPRVNKALDAVLKRMEVAA